MNANNPLILVIEDELPIRRYLRTTLQSHGYRVEEAASAEEGQIQAKQSNPDIVLLDLGLPDGDGLDVVQVLRVESSVPIIVVSARGQEEDKVRALDLGADDYLSKPFGTAELLARIRVALRHSDALAGVAADVRVELGPLRVDFERREVRLNDELVHLSPNEFALLTVLVQHAGKVLTHRQLLREVWGGVASAQTHYLRVYMASLRKKLEPDPARPRLLLTEPGVGYRLKVHTES